MKFEWFILLYSFMKLVRIMLAATVLMTAALVICKIAETGNLRFHLTMFVLCLFPALWEIQNSFLREGCFWLQIGSRAS